MTSGLLTVRVGELRAVASGVLALRLEPIGQAVLPAFEPGAHIDLHLPNGMVRQYSLLDDGPIDGHYRLGVGLSRDSRGGSVYVHQALRPGDMLHVGAPRNLFTLDPAASSLLFIAGGIGITPLLAMARRCAAQQRPWRLLYCVASRLRAAFLDELTALPGGTVTVHVDDEAGQPANLDQWVAGLNAGEHLYCCGPAVMMSRVEDCASPSIRDRLHFEWFAPAPATGSGVSDEDRAFDVLLRSSGRMVHVPAGQSLLDALEAAGESVPFGCREGLCGTCLVNVCAGEVNHRDMVLSSAERAESRQMLICVSRARGALLELDI